jgi:hypothetical protein
MIEGCISKIARAMPSAYRKVPLSPCVGGGRLALHTSRRAAAAGLKRPAFLLMMELGSVRRPKT